MPFLILGTAFFILGTISGTKKKKKIHTLGMKKDKVERPYKLAVLRDRDGDLSKEWYIEFYAFDEEIGDLKRKRIKIPLVYATDESRRKFAAQEIADYNEVLRNGFYFKSEPRILNSAIKAEHMLIESLNSMLDSSTHLRKKSIGTYRTAINKLALALASDIPLSELNSPLIYRVRDQYIKNGNSAVTANKSIDQLGQLYREFAKRHGIENDPFKSISKLPETQQSTRNIAFTKADQEVLEKYLLEQNYPLYLFTRYMYYAFVRPRELRFLRVKHVQVDNLTITVPGEIAKNRKTETVAIIKPLKVLVDLRGYEGNYYLFGTGLRPAKRTCSENTPLTWHTDALKACGLHGKGYTLYSWKHTGAVNAYLSGVGIKQLQLLLRHSTVQMTDIYLKSLGLRTDPNIGNYDW
jgi:integrase